MVARYHFPIGSLDSYVQGAVVYEGERDSDLDQNANAILGTLPSYTTLDLAAGISKDNWSLDLFVANATGENTPIAYTVESTAENSANQIYGIRLRPTTVSLKLTMDFN